MVKGKYVPLGDGKWCARRLKSPKVFDKRSFRTVRPPGRDDVLFTIGCPRGKYDAKRKKCKVGTQRQRVLKLKVKGRCPRAHSR